MNNGNIWTQDPKAKVLGQNNIQLLLVEVEKRRASPPMHKKKKNWDLLAISPLKQHPSEIISRLIYTSNSKSLTLNAGSETRNHGLNNMTKSESHVAYMDNISL